LTFNFTPYNSYFYDKAVACISQFKVSATLTDTMLTKLNRIILFQYSLYLNKVLLHIYPPLSSYIIVSFFQKKIQKKGGYPPFT